MDAVSDPSVDTVVVMKSAQVGWTEIVGNVAGYHIDQDPAPLLLVQPTIEMAEAWSKDRLAPMLRDSPRLRGRVADPRARDSGNTLLHKTFPGGHITMAGANSAASLASRPIRIVLLDEVDRFPASAGTEGDPVTLARKRTVTFWNRKILMGSTPTLAGYSRIDKAFQLTDQRFYLVPCPHCGAWQKLEWGGKDTPHGIKWHRDEQGRPLPETAHYVCINGCVIEERHKPAMVRAGTWMATRPFNGQAGFHIWAGYSLLPNVAWSRLVAEWLEVSHDPLLRQTFVNLVLGEPYEDRGDKALAEARLAARAEVWDAEVPDGVAVITAGVDVQDDRLEIEIVGWGRHEESWSIAHEVISGDPDGPEVWRQVDALLRRTWARRDGRAFPTLAACIDSGGHHTQRVYGFCRERLGRRIWAIKGESARGGMRSPVWPKKPPSRRSKATFRPIIIGVNAAKDSIRARLHIDEPGPGYCHFPADRDINYFAQLVSERSVTVERGGQRFRVWQLPPGRANEALDLRVYAYAALCGLLHAGLKLNRRADEVADSLPPPPLPEPPPETPPDVDLGAVPSAPAAAGPRITVAAAPRKRSLFSGLAR